VIATIDTEGRTSEASPSALCYERPRPHCRRNASANQEEGNKTTVKKMKTTRKQRGSAMRSRRRQPRMRGRQWRDPSPTTGYARRLGDDWRDTAGGTERRTLFFSCNFRWPYAQRRGRHDDAASNDERKQKQFRTGEWRTNKKRHILGALGYLLTFILFLFPKFTTKTWEALLSVNHGVLHSRV
jgi:hypothetical protein